MTTQDVAYAKIEERVKSFKNMPGSQRRSMNEMQTRLGYILPLFAALGWETSNINEVSPEEKVSRGWVDFSFRIGNVPRRRHLPLAWMWKRGKDAGTAKRAPVRTARG